MPIDIAYPNDLTLTFHNNKPPLDTIPENKEINIPMSFKLPKPVSWADIMDTEYHGIFHPFDRLNFQPMVCDFLAEESSDFLDADPFNIHQEEINEFNLRRQYEEDPYEVEETYDHDNDISEFRDINGHRVYFNQEQEIEEGEQEICCSCWGIQDDNVLLTCCRNKHYLCSECFYQEKRKYQRQNADYERQLRQKVKNPQKYQFICPSCNIPEKLVFKTQYQHSEDIVIIPAHKF